MLSVFVGSKPRQKRKPQRRLNTEARICRICNKPFLNGRPHQKNVCSDKSCQDESNRRRARERYRRLHGIPQDRQFIQEATVREPAKRIRSQEQFVKKNPVVMALVSGSL